MMLNWPKSIPVLKQFSFELSQSDSIDSFGVLLLGAIGDAICLTSSLKYIKTRYPGKRIYLVTESPIEQVVPSSLIDGVFVPKAGRLKEGDLFDAIDWLEEKQIKVFFNLHSTFRAALLSFLIEDKLLCPSFGLLSDGKSAWVKGNLWHNLFHRTFYPKFFDQYMANWVIIGRAAMMALCLSSVGIENPSLEITDSSLKNLDVSILKNKQYFVLVPDANAPARRWPVEYFIELAEQIISKYNSYVVLLGKRSLPVRHISGLVNLLGKTSLRQAMALIKNAKAVISNDTGMIHVAGAYSIPTLVICGPNNVGPEARGYFLSVRKEVPCSPCRNAFCDNLLCMKSLKPKEVFSIFNDFMSLNLEPLTKLDSIVIGYSFEQDLNIFFDYHPLSVPYSDPKLCFSVLIKWLLMYSWMQYTGLLAFGLSDLYDYSKFWFSETALFNSLRDIDLVKQRCKLYLDKLLPIQEKIGILIEKKFCGAQKISDAVNKVVLDLPKELVFPWYYETLSESSKLEGQYRCIRDISKRLSLFIEAITNFVEYVGVRT